MASNFKINGNDIENIYLTNSIDTSSGFLYTDNIFKNYIRNSKSLNLQLHKYDFGKDTVDDYFNSSTQMWATPLRNTWNLNCSSLGNISTWGQFSYVIDTKYFKNGNLYNINGATVPNYYWDIIQLYFRGSYNNYEIKIESDIRDINWTPCSNYILLDLQAAGGDGGDKHFYDPAWFGNSEWYGGAGGGSGAFGRLNINVSNFLSNNSYESKHIRLRQYDGSIHVQHAYETSGSISQYETIYIINKGSNGSYGNNPGAGGNITTENVKNFISILANISGKAGGRGSVYSEDGNPATLSPLTGGGYYRYNTWLNFSNSKLELGGWGGSVYSGGSTKTSYGGGGGASLLSDGGWANTSDETIRDAYLGAGGAGNSHFSDYGRGEGGAAAAFITYRGYF